MAIEIPQNFFTAVSHRIASIWNGIWTKSDSGACTFVETRQITDRKRRKMVPSVANVLYGYRPST